jgi:thiopurine S-methyltransferase
MDKDYWYQKWQTNEIGFNQSQPNQLMQRYFPTLHLRPGERVFVPLCGKSIDMLWLAGQGYKVIGVELSQLACKAFFQENKIPVKIAEAGDFIVYSSPEITLLAGDFFKLNKNDLGKIDAVYDRAALIALPAEVRQLYSEYIAGLVEPETSIFLITTSYDQTAMQAPPYSVDENEVKELFGSHFDIKQLYSKPISEIPPHLQTRGLLQATEQIYCLKGKKAPNRG